MNALLQEPDELWAISTAGYELVHGRHTAESRNQMRQWYDLRRTAESGQRIHQSDPFGDLTLGPIERRTIVGPPGGSSEARDRVLLARADALLASGAFDSARAAYSQAGDYHFMSEPGIGIARCCLAAGSPLAALEALFPALHRQTVL